MAEKCKKVPKTCWGCLGLLLFIFVIFISVTWATVGPTEVALIKNTVSGAVDLDRTFTNGRYCVPFQTFIKFPATLQTIAYDRPDGMIRARTGPGEGETDSGGQPVQLSISFQYKLQLDKLPELFRTFGTKWESSYRRFAQQAITNVAQAFTPRQFWEKRAAIETQMKFAVSEELKKNYADVIFLQLRSIEFIETYEDTILNIQLQEQLKVTKSFNLEVTKVLKEIDVLQAETTAAITYIKADAARRSAIIINEAQATALQMEQAAKAILYSSLRAHLNWTEASFVEYVKMKALNAQPPENVVVGVGATGAA